VSCRGRGGGTEGVGDRGGGLGGRRRSGMGERGECLWRGRQWIASVGVEEWGMRNAVFGVIGGGDGHGVAWVTGIDFCA